MIDLNQLRDDPDRFKKGARDKGIEVNIDAILQLDEQYRSRLTLLENKRAEQNRVSKEIGPQIGKVRAALKTATGAERAALEAQFHDLDHVPIRLKALVQSLEKEANEYRNQLDDLLLKVPLPPDADVPVGKSAEDNVQIRTWSPKWFDPARSFEQNKGFPPKTHLELVRDLKLVDFERGVKMSGTRHYVLTGDGARLHQAVLRFALDFITNEHGFAPMTIPVIVREDCMVGTGFFPYGREQAYCLSNLSSVHSATDHDPKNYGPMMRNELSIEIEGDQFAIHQDYSYADGTTKRDTGYRPIEGWLTGTGEVGLMGLHADEILDADSLPLKYCTVSTCFRREAGAAGKDTAGLYRIHQFDKVEQVVICRADEAESRAWHKKMIDIVEQLLQKLEIPYRLLQCCTGDLGPKNADMIDIESWMPGRGEDDPKTGRPRGAYGETHSASRLYDYQCRRLSMRYKDEKGKAVFCHSLNNTVLASPRILIPILELYQNKDGSVTIPEALRPHMSGAARIG